MQLYSSSDSKTADKFVPIKARDYDPEAIKMAKSGVLPIQGYEIEKIQEYTRGKFNEFFDVTKEFQLKTREMMHIPLKKDYTDKIEFSIANITDDYKNISPDNSVVFARNFMPYLKSRRTIIELIKNLGEKLKDGSCLVVGDFDHLGLCMYKINLEEILETFGFKQTEISNVYEKKSKF
jgi:chemotaxis methyl-accepting protein methylase